MPRWQQIDLPESRAAMLAEEKGSRLDLYWIEFDTNVKAERKALRRFIVRPLESLVGGGESEEERPSKYFVPGIAIEGVGPSWRVATTIRNHHRGLNPRITRFVATVSGDEETVYLDAVKQTD
jgi:hypothetical protein